VSRDANERDLAEIRTREAIDEVILAYSDVEHTHVMHKASIALAAGILLLLTDVDNVYLGWRAATAQSVAAAGPSDLDPTGLEPGSMRPKVEAAASSRDGPGNAQRLADWRTGSAPHRGGRNVVREFASGPPDARPIVKPPASSTKRPLARLAQ
jgi:hypothetical protein